MKDIKTDSDSPNNDFVILSRDNSPNVSNSSVNAWYVSLLLVIILLVLPLSLGLDTDPYLCAAGAIVILTYPLILLLRWLGLKSFQLSQEQIVRNIELQKQRNVTLTPQNRIPATSSEANPNNLGVKHGTLAETRVDDLDAKHKKFASALFYLGIFLFGRFTFLVTEYIGLKNLDPKLIRSMQSTALLVSIALVFTLFFALSQLASLAWAIYPRRKAVLIAACSFLAPAFPVVAYIVYRDSKRILLERQKADDKWHNLTFKSSNISNN